MICAGEHDCQVDTQAGVLEGVWLVPEQADALIVFAHGAGAGFRHTNMQQIAQAMAQQRVATLRFNFPFMQAGKRRVDAQPVAIQAICSAVDVARGACDLPLFLGGHSFGGRMSSHAVAERQVVCQGMIFGSFPLHPAKKINTQRALHLADVRAPMLFLSGTRDDLADRATLQTVVDALPLAEVHWLETANHGYGVLKRTRTHSLSVFDEMAMIARGFIDRCLASAA